MKTIAWEDNRLPKLRGTLDMQNPSGYLNF